MASLIASKVSAPRITALTRINPNTEALKPWVFNKALKTRQASRRRGGGHGAFFATRKIFDQAHW